MEENPKIVVLGASGLLGSHLLWELSKQEVNIVGTYRSKEKKDEVLKIFTYYDPKQATERFNKITWSKTDILSIDELRIVLHGANEVYHCAALVSFHRIDFNKCMLINRMGTANVVNVCLENKNLKLCYVSSTAAVGVNPKGLTDESHLWQKDNETSGYSISKFGAEKEVWRGIEEGLDAIIINPCVIIGAGSWKDGSLHIFDIVNKGLRFFPNGNNSIVDARDVAKSMIFLMKSQLKSKRFLCTGDNMSFKRLLKEISIKIGKRPPNISSPKFITMITAYLSESLHLLFSSRKGLTIESAQASYKNIYYDSSALKNTLDFTFYTLEETVENAVKGKTN